MPDCSAEPVVTTSCAFYFLHARLRVHRAPGIPCALCSQRRMDCARLGRIAPRECNWLFSKIHRCCPGQAKRDPGTITTGLSCCAKVIEQRLSNDRHGVWVPAFAGTTASSLPATNAKRLRTGAEATKQSIFDLAMPSRGLLR